MHKIVKYETSNGPIYVEARVPDEEKGGVQKAGLKDDAKKIVQNAALSFEAALENAFVAANSLVDRAAALKIQPSELNIEFGLKISSEIELFVISGDAEANFAIKIKWTRDAPVSAKP